MATPQTLSAGPSFTELPVYGSSQSHLLKPDSVHIQGESHSYPTVLPEISAEAGEAASHVQKITSKKRSVAIIFSIAMVTGVSSMLNGLVTVILPTLIKDLGMSADLQVWYV